MVIMPQNAVLETPGAMECTLPSAMQQVKVPNTPCNMRGLQSVRAGFGWKVMLASLDRVTCCRESVTG
jgi:hypothetical protein